jgi:ubiquinone/menaquinone biosynthesis C-methylase UbiE
MISCFATPIWEPALKRLVLLICLYALSFTPGFAQGHSDRAAIAAVLMKTFDRPEARLVVEPVIVEGDIAIAGWLQEGRGGRALMRRKGHHWIIALCAGEALRHEHGLRQVGLEAAAAKRLASAIAKAESALPKTTVARFDSFEGTVVMDEHGNHPPVHGHGAAHSQHAQHTQHGPHGAPAEAQHAHEGAAQHSHHNRFDDAAKWSQTFDDPKRDAWQMPHELLTALALKPGDVVADLGAGTGYLAVRLAHHVPQGKVFAADLSKDMVAFLGKRAKENNIANLVALQASEASPNLPEKVDVAVLLDVYHHISGRIAYFRNLAPSLKPGARVAVIDFRPEAPAGAPKHMRLPVSKVDEEMQVAGYERIASHDFLPRQYFLVYRLK